ncbi:hypothetical protein OHT76_41145 [Streptomyces sp. NBC_00287]|nr:hypothetical protein [Streptomyces sp. NBC_00287]
MQDVIVAALSERAAAAGTPYPAGDPTLRAITAAALDKAMAAVAPQTRP